VTLDWQLVFARFAVSFVEKLRSAQWRI